MTEVKKSWAERNGDTFWFLVAMISAVVFLGGIVIESKWLLGLGFVGWFGSDCYGAKFFGFHKMKPPEHKND